MEHYNGIASDSESAYYEGAYELLSDSSQYSGNTIYYYIYDLDGYYITSSDPEADKADWSEYMSTPISQIYNTKVLRSSNINHNHGSIDIITPVIVKKKVVGLVRANISSAYFGSFLPENGSAFVIAEDGSYLFSAAGFPNKEQEGEALTHLNDTTSSGYIKAGSNSVKNIYGYARITFYRWIYVIKQDGTHYAEILRTLPQILVLALIIILILSYMIGSQLAKKFTDPIFSLKHSMRQATTGNLTQRSDLRETNEFGDLSNMFNNMMDIIESNYKQLDESHKVLEAQQEELKTNYDKIEQLAYHDALTGLYNRLAFMEFSDRRFHEERDKFERHAIFFIDLDNFKTVNDTLGHDYGDLLLIDVSKQLTSCISDTDILSRTGGDEFLIMKSDFDSKEALSEFADRLVNIVRRPFNLKGETANVSMSVGVAIYPEDGQSVTELIKNSDIAMYNAKNGGKNNFCFFNSIMEDNVVREKAVSDTLTNVMNKDELYLLYQPQVSVKNGRVTGFEALMRINSVDHGLMTPNEFIPIAEENGSIHKLGEWALTEACTFNKSIFDRGFGELKVSVNIANSQLTEDLVLIIRELPNKTGLPLSSLEVEIPEPALNTDFEKKLSIIKEIKKLGVSIALDSFGTGYSSLNYLSSVPIDTLKIDKSFIDGINAGERNRTVAKSIIDLAHQMNINVVAEGVEDIGQLSILQRQYCDTLQGYLFSKPIRGEEFIAFLERHAKASMLRSTSP